MQRHFVRSRQSYLTSLSAMILVAICTAGARADICIVLTGTADLTVNGQFHQNEAFEVEFCAVEPATDMLTDPSRGLFAGTATLTLADPALLVTNLGSTNVDALRQDQNPEGIFLVDDANPFNNAFSTVFTQGGVIADANVFDGASSAGQWQGAGLAWELTDGSTVQFNQVANLTVAPAVVAVPEPTATIILIAGTPLLVVRRRK